MIMSSHTPLTCGVLVGEQCGLADVSGDHEQSSAVAVDEPQAMLAPEACFCLPPGRHAGQPSRHRVRVAAECHRRVGAAVRVAMAVAGFGVAGGASAARRRPADPFE